VALAAGSATGPSSRPPSAGDRAFSAGKVAAAKFFAATVLPELAARRVAAEATDADSVMSLPEAAF
jgi:hypothetical protein